MKRKEVSHSSHRCGEAKARCMFIVLKCSLLLCKIACTPHLHHQEKEGSILKFFFPFLYLLFHCRSIYLMRKMRHFMN